jgi:hypothetical protein
MHSLLWYTGAFLFYGRYTHPVFRLENGNGMAKVLAQHIEYTGMGKEWSHNNHVMYDIPSFTTGLFVIQAIYDLIFGLGIGRALVIITDG